MPNIYFLKQNNAESFFLLSFPKQNQVNQFITVGVRTFMFERKPNQTNQIL
jgi:hypothetical protein